MVRRKLTKNRKTRNRQNKKIRRNRKNKKRHRSKCQANFKQTAHEKVSQKSEY